MVVFGISLLLDVVAELGAEARAEKKMRTADGVTHEVDYVVKDGAAEVGVQVDKKSEKVTLIPRDCNAGPGKALAGRIAQRWAYSRAVGELKRKGYAVAKEEKQADGTVDQKQPAKGNAAVEQHAVVAGDLLGQVGHQRILDRPDAALVARRVFHARCVKCESTETPITWAFFFSNFANAASKAMISDGQTNVKSNG